MIRVIEGDILESDAPFIAHQVNCQGAMNSGVARQIRQVYPTVYDQYMECYHNGKAELGFVQIVPTGNGQNICNLFAQDKYGYDKQQYTSIDALTQCFRQLNRIASGSVVALPYKIGCVRGGADWSVVYDIISKVFTDCDVELWRLDKG